MRLAGAVAVGVARVAGDVADGVVDIGMVVWPRAAGGVGGAAAVAGEGMGQPVQRVVLEALALAAVHAVHQAGDVAHRVIGVRQVLQVGVRTGDASPQGGQSHGGLVVDVLAGQAVAAGVQPLLDHLAARVVGRAGHVGHAAAADT